MSRFPSSSAWTNCVWHTLDASQSGVRIGMNASAASIASLMRSAHSSPGLMSCQSTQTSPSRSVSASVKYRANARSRLAYEMKADAKSRPYLVKPRSCMGILNLTDFSSELLRQRPERRTDLNAFEERVHPDSKIHGSSSLRVGGLRTL